MFVQPYGACIIMTNLNALAIKTRYWRPGQNFLEEMAVAITDHVEDGDIVTVSEKALSTAIGNILDESMVKPGLVARFVAKYWMRYVWGYFLGPLCHLRVKNIDRIRNYPLRDGSIHKQVALKHAGVLQALLWGSEGGIDASNLPYSYVSLPIKQPNIIARRIRDYIENRLGKRVTVIIVDTDKTYSIGGFHFTPRPKPLTGICSSGGFIAYVLGRALRLKRRSTPLAVAGSEMGPDLALDIAEATHKLRRSGAGATVWDMVEGFGVPLTGVTWEMLERIDHMPVVIFKFR